MHKQRNAVGCENIREFNVSYKVTRLMVIVLRKVAFYGQIGSSYHQLLCSSYFEAWLTLTAMIWVFLLYSLLY